MTPEPAEPNAFTLGAEDEDTFLRLCARMAHYFSTYCLRERHGDCRGTCKFCRRVCRCPCHRE